MANLWRWNGAGEDDLTSSHCVCQYCTPGTPVQGYVPGEDCPCGSGVMAECVGFLEWVECEICGFAARNIELEIRSYMSK